MADAPQFDPTKPFETEGAPKFDPSQPFDVEQPQQPSAAQNVVNASFGNPDEAAKALGIANQTGLPPQLVKTNPDKFQNDAHRAQALEIVQKNPDFANWLQRRQINAEVAFDEIPKLEGLFNSAKYWHSQAQTSFIWEGIKKGMAEGLEGPWTMTDEEKHYFQNLGVFRNQRNEGLMTLPRLANEIGITTLYDLGHTAGRFAQAGFGAWHGFVQALVDRGLNRDFAAVLHGEYMPPGSPVGFNFGAGNFRAAAESAYSNTLDHLDRIAQASPDRFRGKVTVKSLQTGETVGEIGTPQPPVSAVNEITRQTLRNGEVPRPGLDPITDAVHVEQQLTDAQAFDDLFNRAQDSKLRERSPETFADMMRGAVGGQNIYVPAKTVLEAYAGKVQRDGDPIFGWMTNSVPKIDQALKTGTDLSVPMEEFLAHADPKVYDLIKDQIKFRESGVSNEEAQALQALKPEDYTQEKSIAETTSGGAEGGSTEQPRPAEAPAPQPTEQAAVSTQQPPKVAPIVAFRKEANGIEKALVPPDEGYTRLWRGNRPGEEGKATSFTNDLPGIALPFRKHYGGRLSYVDVKTEDLGKYENKAGTATGAEFNVPEEIARQAKSVDGGFGGTPKTESVEDRLIGELKNLGEAGEQEALRLRDVIKEALHDSEIRDAVDNLLENPNGAKEAIGLIRKFGEGHGTVPPTPPATPLGEAFRREKKFLYLNPLFKDPAAAGMDATRFNRYSRNIQAQDQAAYDKILQAEMRAASKRLTPEWEKDYGRITQEVESDLRSSPPIVADRFIRTGELPTGEIIGPRKLDEEATLRYNGGQPLGRYTVKRGGINPDELAPMLGFNNGVELVRALREIDDGMAAADKGPNAYLKLLVKKEADRRMEIAHGTLSENILDEARELATGEPYIDILSDELTELRRNLKEVPGDIPLTKDMMKADAERMFAQQTAQDVSYRKYADAANRNAIEAEKALLSGDFRTAFEAKQRQIYNVLNAKMARVQEKKLATAEKNFQRIMRNEERGGIDQDYWDNVRNILSDVGFSSQKVQAPLKSLQELITESSGQVQTAPWLDGREPMTQVYKELTVEEHNALNDSIRSILNAGRDAKRVDSVHAAANLDNVVFDIRKENERFGVKPLRERQSIPQRAGSYVRAVNAWNVLVERLFDYADKFDPKGPITQFIDRPLREAYGTELKLQEQVVNKLKALQKYQDGTLNDTVDNPFMKDRQGLYPMTRKNLRYMMLHMGTDSNMDKLLNGHGITLDQAMELVRRNATANDVAWVNGMHEIFEFLGDQAAPMIRRYTGVEFKKLPPRPYSITLRDGKDYTLNGGYAPVVYDKSRSTIPNSIDLKGDLFDPEYFTALPAHGYTMPRTKAYGWMDLNGTLMASRMNQMIHDIAFREAVRNAQKFLSHPAFRESMVDHWGEEYANLLNPWLKDIANAHNFDDAVAQGAAHAMAVARQAVTSTLVNYNVGTMLKHGSTAGFMSAAQINSRNPFAAFRDIAAATKDVGLKGMYNTAADMLKRQGTEVFDEAKASAARDVLMKENVRQFIIESSPIFRNRARIYADTVQGAFEQTMGGGTNSSILNTLGRIRDKNEQIGRFMVAMSDMASAMPLWWDTYKKAMQRTGVHSDAVFEADRVVARAHGSNFIGDKPFAMRIGGNSFLGQVGKTFTSLYGFWNHLFNNLVQLGWDMGAIAKRGSGSEPGANYASIINRTILYGVIPVAVEELMAPALTKDNHEGFAANALKATIRTFGGLYPWTRDLANYAAGGYEPSVGMIGSGLKILEDAANDQFKKTSRNAIAHFGAVLGMLGIGSAQVGRTMQGAEKQYTGQETPRTLEEYRALYRKGYIRPLR